MSAAQFDPRPLKAAATLAVAFIALPGTYAGAALLHAFGGGSVLVGFGVPLVVPASTHAMVQLAGGFMTLILGFLAFGVPHLLGLDAQRARLVLVPIALIALSLALDVVGELGASSLVVGARWLGVGAATLAIAMMIRARVDRERRLVEMPLPFIVLALALYPLAWLAFALEAHALVVAGVAADAALLLVVIPVVMSMGFKMFSAMLQLDTGDPRRLKIALSAWIGGGVILVVTRALGVDGIARAGGGALLLCGAAAWLASLHGLRRKTRGLALAQTVGAELRVHIVVAAACLLAAPALWSWAVLARSHAGEDFARHVLAIGFVLVVTMGVTLRALPRFVRGVPSSPALALVTLALVVIGLVLRAGRMWPDAQGAQLVRLSAMVTFAAVVMWGAHLARGLYWKSRAPDAG